MVCKGPSIYKIKAKILRKKKENSAYFRKSTYIKFHQMVTTAFVSPVFNIVHFILCLLYIIYYYILNILCYILYVTIYFIYCYISYIIFW